MPSYLGVFVRTTSLPKAPKEGRAQCGQTQQLFLTRTFSTGPGNLNCKVPGKYRQRWISPCPFLPSPFYPHAVKPRISFFPIFHPRHPHLRPPNKRRPRRLPPVSPRFALCIVKSNLEVGRRHPGGIDWPATANHSTARRASKFSGFVDLGSYHNVTSLFLHALSTFSFFCFLPSLATLLRRLCRPLVQGVPRGADTTPLALVAWNNRVIDAV